MIMSWEVTILEYWGRSGGKYRVTRRMPEHSVAEAKIFNTKKEALRQFNEWV